jgi:hypothetical protein
MKAAISATSVCIFLGSFVGPVTAVSAQTAPGVAVSDQRSNIVSVSEATGKGANPVVITVSSYGMVVSFVELGESIEKYWMTDTTNLKIGSDVSLGRGARLLFLKSSWPPGSNPPGTSLTVLTRAASGHSQIYNFLIEFTNNRPNYSMVSIYPDSSPALATRGTSAPRAQQPRTQERSNPSRKPKSSAESQPYPATVSAEPRPQPNPPVVSVKPTPEPELQPSPSVVSVKPTPEPELQPSPPVVSVKPTPEPESQPDPPAVSVKPTPEPESQPDPPAVSAKPTPESESQVSPQSSPPVAVSPLTTAPERTNPVSARPSQAFVDQVNALVRGLVIANQRKEIRYNSAVASRVQNLMRRLRRGENIQNAAKLELVPFSTVRRLLQLGNYQGEV